MKTIKNYIIEAKHFLIKGHTKKQNKIDFVDLGLPSGNLWATCNLGAEHPEDPGDFYAWGETEPKKNYSWETYKFGDPDNGAFSKYNNHDKKAELDKEDDVVNLTLKNNCYIPSKADIDELMICNDLKYEIVDDYNNSKMNGLLITSKINNNQIFLPAAGMYIKDIIKRKNKRCLYLTRELCTDYEYNYRREYALELTDNDWDCDWDVIRKNGCQIRPIKYTK